LAGHPRRDSATARLIEILPSHPVVNLRTAMELTGARQIKRFFAPSIASKRQE